MHHPKDALSMQREQLRFSTNKYPYTKRHGLTITSQGSYEGLALHGSMLYQWNLPRDPESCLPNVDNFDAEKDVY